VPEAPDHRKRLANAQLELGKFLVDEGRPREADACYGGAVSQWENLAAAFPQMGSYRQALSVALRLRGELLQAAGNLGEAEKVVRQAVVLLDKLADDFPAALEYQRARALGHTQLAALLAATSRRAETEAAFGQALAFAEKLATTFPTVPTFRADLAVVQDQWGQWLMTRRMPAEAEAKFRRAIALLEKLAAQRPTAATYPRQLAWLLATCPHPQVRDPRRAVALARQAVERSPQDASAWSVLGVAQGRAGDWAAALASLQKAVALPGGGDATDGFWLALAHAHLDHPDQARESYRGAVRWMEANRPRDAELQRLRAEVERLLSSAASADRPSKLPGPKQEPG
jgi:tetratricopeptide (TPR) repeat protein